jgi:subtilisin family serine protease
MGRKSTSILGRSFSELLVGRERQRRKSSWMFERLEERYLFSVTPATLAAQAGPAAFGGTLTQEQVTMGELWTAFQQASNLSQYTDAQLQSVTQWALWSVDPLSGAASSAGFSPYSEGSVISTINTDGMTTTDVISQLSSTDNLLAYYPLIQGVNATATASALDEPLFDSQWHLRSIGQNVGSPDFQDILSVPGQDINVVGAWNQGYSGQGVTVGVIDSGFQTNHPDLFDNYNAALSANFSTGAGSHGTAVAGLIGADGNNHYGTVGVAYNADLVNIDIGSDTALNLTNTVLSYRNDAIDIYNLSLGDPSTGQLGNTGRLIIPLEPNMVFALRNAVLFGRPDENGKPLGNIFVKASGNDGGTNFENVGFPQLGGWDSSQYEGLSNSRYVITVGAVDHDGVYFNSDGTLTNYPEAGANVLVVAPTGSVSLDIGVDTGTGSGIWTTDLTGENGYNSAGNLDADFLDNTDFTSRFNGTSAAAPIVSGVIALMLEANPNLSYRDVQEILVRSARQNSLQEDPDGDYEDTAEGWQTNMYEPWQSPSLQLVPVDPDDPENLELKAVPFEDPFDRTDIIVPGSIILATGEIINSSGRDLDPLRTLGGFYPEAVPINNYTLYNLPMYENGAGYTVHDARGIYSEEYGYAHGVVDAELAVALAKQWTVKDQTLPKELTYTTFARPSNFNIPSAAFVGPDGADDLYIIPGLVGGGTDEEFHEYYDEFFADMPFDGDDPPVDDNGTYLPISLLDGFNPPLMQIEWVEVKIQVSGMDMNRLRIALRSPDGTISDLNMPLQEFRTLFEVNMNFQDQDDFHVNAATSPADGTLLYTFSTNRHWGERSDAFFEIDSATGLPKIDPDTGQTIFRSWDLIVENYDGGSSGVLNAFEVIFHGTPIGQSTERISGHVGIDAGSLNGTAARGDGNFNFSRGYDVDVNGDGNVDTRIIDRDPEPWGANVTLKAVDASGNTVAQFVTGADGNYYFDLAPGPNGTPATYTIKIVDPEGRAMDDTGLNPRYLKEWQVIVDPNDNFTRAAGRQVPIDDDGDGIQDYDDINMNGIQDPSEPLKFRNDFFNDADFLLDAGTLPEEKVEVSGTVYADSNGNGVVDGGTSADVGVAMFTVYADINNSGSFEQDEPNAVTDGNGYYSFTVDNITVPQNIKIVAKPLPGGWLATGPVTGFQTIYRGPGEVVADLNFLFKPPADTDPNVPPIDPTLPGTILGQVWNDRNGNGVQGASDQGVEGVRVFIDANGDQMFNYTDANTNGKFDEGETALEPTAVTNSFGGYSLNGITAGLIDVYVIAPEFFTPTSPLSGFRQANLVAGGIVNNVKFGIHNLATRDFGDLLGAGYFTTGPMAASHEIIPGFQLGAKIDGELDGQPTADAKGDDNISGDEDGVVLVGALSNPTGVLVAGTTNVVQVTVSGVGGYLNAWFDFNRDGDFDDAGEHALINLDINPGAQNVQFAVPGSMVAGTIPARFRWGTAGVDYKGSDIIGEVEDYLFANANMPSQSVAVPGDYDGSGTVDDGDYAFWKNSFGSTSNLAADGNNDGTVNAADYSVWRNHLGQSGAIGGGSASSATSGGLTAAPIWRDYVSSGVGQNMTPGSPEYAALMQKIGATATTFDLGARGTVTVYGYDGSGSAGGQASGESPSTTTASVASPTASVEQASQQFVPFSTTVSPRESTPFARRHDHVASDSSGADLLLVDRVLSRFGGSDDGLDEVAPLRESGRHHDDDFALALASAFEDDADWWTMR